MKKQYFKIITSSIIMLSAFSGMAQTDQPVLERRSSVPKQKTIEESSVQPELNRGSIIVTVHKNSSDSLERLNTPALKRYESSSIRKEQPNNSK